MADDWETFSASPYQQPAPAIPGMSLAQEAICPLLLLDWPDDLSVISAMILGGKKGVWLDLVAAEEMGLSGQDIQNRLKRNGIELHARALFPLEGTVAAIVVVDAEKEEQVRNLFERWGILL